MTATLEQEFFSAAEVATFLGLSKATILKMAKIGELPQGVKIGHSRKWNLNAVKAFLGMGVGGEKNNE